MLHFPTPKRAFEFISADWFEVNGGKFLVIVDWYSGWYEVAGPIANPDSTRFIQSLRDWFVNKAVPDYLVTDMGPPFGSSEVADFLKRWKISWSPSSPYYAQGNGIAEHAVFNAKSLLRKVWKKGERSPMSNDEWIKGILQYRNTPNKSTKLSPAIMIFGHAIQDNLPAHKSALDRKWHDEVLRVDREAAKRKQTLEEKWNCSSRSLPVLNVQDSVLVQNQISKKWDRQGTVMERNLKIRRYLIRLESGMMIYRNRRHLRKLYMPSNAVKRDEKHPAVPPTLEVPMIRDGNRNLMDQPQLPPIVPVTPAESEVPMPATEAAANVPDRTPSNVGTSTPPVASRRTSTRERKEPDRLMYNKLGGT